MSTVFLDLERLNRITLQHGSHNGTDVEGGCCGMEAVAVAAGKPKTDHPGIGSPVCELLTIRVNDLFGPGPAADTRRTAALRPLLPLLLVTFDAPEHLEQRRVFYVLNWTVSTMLPVVLDAGDQGEQATVLRELQPLTDADTVESARKAIRPAFSATRSISPSGVRTLRASTVQP